MSTAARIFYIFFAVIAVAVLWVWRIDAKPTAVQVAGVIVTDRWTGRVYSCFLGSPCQQLYPQD